MRFNPAIGSSFSGLNASASAESSQPICCDVRGRGDHHEDRREGRERERQDEPVV